MDLLSSDQGQNLWEQDVDALFTQGWSTALQNLKTLFSNLEGDAFIRAFKKCAIQINQHDSSIRSDFIEEITLPNLIKLKTNKHQFEIAKLSVEIYPSTGLQYLPNFRQLIPSQTLQIALQAIKEDPKSIDNLYEYNNVKSGNPFFQGSCNWTSKQCLTILSNLYQQDLIKALFFLKRICQKLSSKETYDALQTLLLTAKKQVEQDDAFNDAYTKHKLELQKRFNYWSEKDGVSRKQLQEEYKKESEKLSINYRKYIHHDTRSFYSEFYRIMFLDVLSKENLVIRLNGSDQLKFLEFLTSHCTQNASNIKYFNDILFKDFPVLFDKINLPAAVPLLKIALENGNETDLTDITGTGSYYLIDHLLVRTFPGFEQLSLEHQSELLLCCAKHHPEAITYKYHLPVLKLLSPNVSAVVCWEVYNTNPRFYEDVKDFFIYPEDKKTTLKRFVDFLNVHPNISMLSENFYPEIIKAKLEIPDILILWENEKRTKEVSVLNAAVEPICNSGPEAFDNFITHFLIPLINKIDFQQHTQPLIKALEFIHAVQTDNHYTKCITDFFESLRPPSQPRLCNLEDFLENFEKLENHFCALFLNNPTFVEKFTHDLSPKNQAILTQYLCSKNNDTASTVLPVVRLHKITPQEYAVILLRNVFQRENETLKPIILKIIDFNQNHPVLIEEDAGKYETRHLFNLAIQGLDFAWFNPLTQKIIITDIQFENVQFINSNWSQLTLDMASFIECDLRGTNFQAVTAPQIAMVNTNLEGADFSHANLQDGQLIQCNFRGTNLNSADLSRIWCGPKKVSHFSNANLSDANLTEAKLGKADFENANLEGANCTDAIFEGNLKRIQAQRANFTGVNLNIEPGMLEGADLRNTVWTGAKIRSLDVFFNTDLCGANLKGIRELNKKTFSDFLNGCVASYRPLIDSSTLIDD